MPPPFRTEYRTAEPEGRSGLLNHVSLWARAPHEGGARILELGLEEEDEELVKLGLHVTPRETLRSHEDLASRTRSFLVASAQDDEALWTPALSALRSYLPADRELTEAWTRARESIRDWLHSDPSPTEVGGLLAFEDRSLEHLVLECAPDLDGDRLRSLLRGRFEIELACSNPRLASRKRGVLLATLVESWSAEETTDDVFWRTVSTLESKSGRPLQPAEVEDLIVRSREKDGLEGGIRELSTRAGFSHSLAMSLIPEVCARMEEQRPFHRDTGGRALESLVFLDGGAQDERLEALLATMGLPDADADTSPSRSASTVVGSLFARCCQGRGPCSSVTPEVALRLYEVHATVLGEQRTAQVALDSAHTPLSVLRALARQNSNPSVRKALAHRSDALADPEIADILSSSRITEVQSALLRNPATDGAVFARIFARALRAADSPHSLQELFLERMRRNPAQLPPEALAPFLSSDNEEVRELAFQAAGGPDPGTAQRNRRTVVAEARRDDPSSPFQRSSSSRSRRRS